MSKQNLLLVDDHKENLVALEAVLAAPQRQLLMATSGNEALALALKHDLSLILLDVQMPDMDGFEVAELLRRNRRTRSIPIIFVTAISKEQKYVFKGYESGAVDYLFKPLDEKILTAKVNIFLDMDAQKRRLQQAVVQMKRLKDENERLLQALGEAVIGTDAQGRISFCNDTACALLAREHKQLVGQSFADLFFHDEQGNDLWSWDSSPLVTSCRNGQRWQNEDEPFYVDVGGERSSLVVSASPLSDDDFTGVVVVFRETSAADITDAERRARAARRYPRKKMFKEMVIFDKHTGGNVGKLLDISLGGFKMSTRLPLEEGQKLSLCLVLPQQINGASTMTFDSRAQWTQEKGQGNNEFYAGCEFSDLSDYNKGIINTLMEMG
jgi:CheY-like chemotaxis protein